MKKNNDHKQYRLLLFINWKAIWAIWAVTKHSFWIILPFVLFPTNYSRMNMVFLLKIVEWILKTHGGSAMYVLIRWWIRWNWIKSVQVVHICRYVVQFIKVHERLQSWIFHPVWMILIHFGDRNATPSNSSANNICTQLWLYKLLISIHYSQMKCFRIAKLLSIYLRTYELQSVRSSKCQ